MGLFSLTRRRSPPLYQFSAGQAAYPLPIRHGDTWSGELRFKRTGPAETVRVRMALYVAGAPQWTEYTSVVLGRDAAEKEYTVLVSGPYDSKGLPECQRIDTKLELVDSTGKVWQDTSTERFHNVVKGTQTWSIIIYDEPFPKTISMLAYDWSPSIGLSQGSGLWSYPIYQFGTYQLNLSTGALILLSPGGSSVQVFGTGFRPGATDWFLYWYDGGWQYLGQKSVASPFTVPTLDVNYASALSEVISFIEVNTPLTIAQQQVSIGASNPAGDPATLRPTDVDWSLMPQGNHTFAFWVAPASGVTAAGLTWNLRKYDGATNTVYTAIPVAGGWEDTGLWWAGTAVDDWNLRLAQIIMHEWAIGLKKWLAIAGIDIQTIAEMGIGREAKVDWITHFFPQITPEMWSALFRELEAAR